MGDVKKCRYAGFNGFQQFGVQTLKTYTPLDFEQNAHEEFKLFSFSWSYNVLCTNNKIKLFGFFDGKRNNSKEFKLIGNIKFVDSNDSICLILMENGEIFKLNIATLILEQINFTSIECVTSRNIFGQSKKTEQDVVVYIACGNFINVAITKKNIVYNIPSKIYEFPKHLKIIKLVCGFEHALVLTSNGDVFAWGNGLRGQLGIEISENYEKPTLVEALSGIKIIKISAGGWHSAAISVFGDLYTWGWNTNGQLGIKIYERVSIDSEKRTLRKKNPSVYIIPQIIDIDTCCIEENNKECENICSINKVFCGARHTIIQKSCGNIFCCGWNEHGQLGLGEEIEYKDQFTKMNYSNLLSSTIICGPWCTVFLEKSFVHKNDK